jgi:YD repeat-containing protein
MNRLTQMTVDQAPTLDAITKYSWTTYGKLLSMIDPRTKTYSYQYDYLARLRQMTYPIDSGGVARTEAYTYDWTSNVATFKNRAGDRKEEGSHLYI